MNYKTHNDTDLFAEGCLQGEIKCEYKTLKKLFGLPEDSDGYKVDAEWVIKFEDGSQCHIYGWKNGKNYLGKNGIPKTKITKWHVGGVDKRGLKNLKRIIKK